MINVPDEETNSCRVVGFTVIGAICEGTLVIFKLFSALGCEQRKGSGLLSPFPFTLQITGPPEICGGN